MSVIIDTTRSEIEAVIRYARDGANNCMIANSWEIKELVRCKDCKHYREADPAHPDCDWCNRMICGTIRKGFFCADGERRSE